MTPTAARGSVSVTSQAEHCRCCGSRSVEKRATKTARFSGLDFSLYRCRECSFLFVDPVADPAAIYTDLYYEGKGADPLVDYVAELRDGPRSERTIEFRDLMRIVGEHFGPQPRLGPVRWLDYGCGAGGLLQFLEGSGEAGDGSAPFPIEVAGFDTGSFAARLRAETTLTVLDPEQLKNVPDGSFDVVSCIEVIEHVMEPRPVIDELARVLAPGGLLALTTGNMAAPVARLLGFRHPYCVPEIHVSLFNPDLLCRLYREAGLDPVWHRYRGVVEYRSRKSLPGPLSKSAPARRLVGTAPARWLADRLFGVSAMPMAVKP